MRIAHLTATFPPYLGGAGTTTLHLARGLAARGHEVEVLTAEVDHGPDPEMGGVRLRRLPALAAVGNAPLLPDLLRAADHDVVHLHHPFLFGTELTLLRRLLRGRGQALVVSYHNRLVGSGGRALLFRGWELTWERLLLEAADRVCVLSEGHAASVPQLASLALRRRERIAVLPNGVDLDLFRPGDDEAGVRGEHGIPPDAVVAAFVATLDRAHYFKRLDRAIDALRRSGEESLHLLVVGAGEDLEAYRRAAAEAGVAERVHFAGAAGHDRLPDLLRAADLLLLASDPPESFGIVLIEAMATALPTVSTDLPGVASVGVPGETGLVATREDPDALSSALRTVVAAGAEGRRRMGLAARAHAEAHYAWPRLVERTEAIYAGALGERAARRTRGVRRPTRAARRRRSAS